MGDGNHARERSCKGGGYPGHHFRFDAKLLTAPEYFLTTAAEDEWIPDLEAHDALSVREALPHPPIDLILRRLCASRRLFCDSELAPNELLHL